MSENFPTISAELMEALEALWPEQSADIRWSNREVFYKAGQRAVVRFLRMKFDEQSDDGSTIIA